MQQNWLAAMVVEELTTESFGDYRVLMTDLMCHLPGALGVKARTWE